MSKTIYGIGNPLIDIIAPAASEDLERLGVAKGAMHLISAERRKELLSYIKGRDARISCGGSCPNTVVTLSALGVKATLAGNVGDDDEGRLYRKNLADQNVKDELICCDQPTGSSIILITEDSERTMNTYLGANRYYSEESIVESSLENADFFHFTGYMWDTEPQKGAIRKAIAIAERNNVSISFDVADPFAVERYRDDFISLIKEHCDIVFANRDEARLLMNNSDACECCRLLGEMCRTAVVKNGRHGSYVSHDGVIYGIELYGPPTAVDTTGAGDNYAAGFLYGLCNDLDVVRSGKIASLLAGEVVSKVGAQLDRNEIAQVKQKISEILR